MSDRYNGWANRETWRFSLWLNNTEGMESEVVDFIADFRLDNEGDFETRKEWLEALAKDYKNKVVYDDILPSTASFFSGWKRDIAFSKGNGLYGWARDVLIGEVEQVNFVEVLEPFVDEHFESWEIVKED